MFGIKITSFLIVLITLVLGGVQLKTTLLNDILHDLSEDEQKAVEAIALYPEKERNIILEAASYPEVLVRMQNIRKNTEEKFKTLLENLPEEDQKKLFNLSRYPDLIGKMGENKKTQTELDELITGYPKEIQEQAVFANQQYYALLTNMNTFYKNSEMAFETILKDYDLSTQQAYKELVKLPEIVTILAENMSATVLLGDLYKKNPVELKKELNSLHIAAAEQKAKELNEWKQNLEDNPEAMAEYEQAAKEFATEQGVNESDYTTYVPEEKKSEVEIRYVYQPYPYWFGWPWWYHYEYWYPYPYWYHWGYYYSSPNVIVFIGLPSNYYMNWHFHHHNHFYHYPYFTNHVINYYYGHRKSRSSVTTVVSNWEKEIRPEVPKNFFDNDNSRIDRIKEYGRFKMDYQSTVQKANGKVPNQMDYLKNNANKYPTLKPVLNEKSIIKPQPIVKEKKPKIEEYYSPKYEPKEKIIKIKTSTYQEIDRAKNYHQNTLEKPIPRYQTISKPTLPRQITPKQVVPRQPTPPQKQPQPITPQRKKK